MPSRGAGLRDEPLIPGRTVIVLVATTVLLGVAFVVTLGINRFVVEIPDLKLMFDMGQEGNVPTWWNTVLLLGVAGVLLLAARLDVGRGRPTGRSLLIAAFAVGYLSLDEAAELHELAGNPTASWLAERGIEIDTYAWVVPGALVAAAAVVISARWCRALAAPVRRSTTLALGLYAAGALGVESINGWLRTRDAEYPYVVGTLIEEWLEMGACIVALHGFGRLGFFEGSALRNDRGVASGPEPGQGDQLAVAAAFPARCRR